MKKVNLRSIAGEKFMVHDGTERRLLCPLQNDYCNDYCVWFDVRLHSQNNGVSFALCKADVIAEIVVEVKP